MRQKNSDHLIGEQQDDSHSENPIFKIGITSSSADYNEQEASSKNDMFSNNCKRLEAMNPQEMKYHRRTEQKSLICCSSSEALLATKSAALKLLKLFWIKTPSRVLILLCFVYIFSLHHYQPLYPYIILLIALVCIRLFVAKKLPMLKLLNTHTPVVWSIGPIKQPEENIVSGFLVRVYSNGDVYEGEFYKGKCSGSGVYYYNMNGRYEGDWVDHKYDGYGVETWAKGSRYRGQYRHGLRHGFGVYRSYADDMYAGEWVNGQCNGYGVHTCADGSKYFGEFKGGVKHGLGHYHFRNGDMYAGEYFGEKMHGFGIYNFANGHRYEGSWHEGKRQGFGLYTFRNGETQCGHWEDGVLSINPHYPMSISHAKVLTAVKEARRLADKAMASMNVDEKLNRAMAAASRASNAARVAAVKAVQIRVHHYDEP